MGRQQKTPGNEPRAFKVNYGPPRPWRGHWPSPLREAQLPEGTPQAPDGLAIGLLIDLLGLELGLQFLHFWAVVPLAAAGAPMQLYPTRQLVATVLAGGEQMEQITAQVGEAQAFVQRLLLRCQLIKQQLHLDEAVAEMTDGDRRKPLVIGAQRCAGSSPGGNAQCRQQRQGLGAAGDGFDAGGVLQLLAGFVCWADGLDDGGSCWGRWGSRDRGFSWSGLRCGCSDSHHSNRSRSCQAGEMARTSDRGCSAGGTESGHRCLFGDD